jgi:hypothetical protein
MSSDGAAPRAAVAPGAPPRAATRVSNARIEASRKNGAKSRGPKTPEGKARARLNAIKHGMRAAMHVVLPDENALEFHALQEALLDELAPEGALQLVLARRVAVAAWRLARADRMEVELFEERRWENAGVGMALIRDGNGTRSFETLMRYRSAAMAEFMRALRTLKALQAGQATASEQDVALTRRSTGAIARVPLSARPPRNDPEPKEPEPHRSGSEATGWAAPNGAAPSRALHEPPAPWAQRTRADGNDPRGLGTPDANRTGWPQDHERTRGRRHFCQSKALAPCLSRLGQSELGVGRLHTKRKRALNASTFRPSCTSSVRRDMWLRPYPIARSVRPDQRDPVDERRRLGLKRVAQWCKASLSGTFRSPRPIQRHGPVEAVDQPDIGVCFRTLVPLTCAGAHPAGACARRPPAWSGWPCWGLVRARRRGRSKPWGCWPTSLPATSPAA